MKDRIVITSAQMVEVAIPKHKAYSLTYYAGDDIVEEQFDKYDEAKQASKGKIYPIIERLDYQED
jgi:hypothetical protein